MKIFVVGSGGREHAIIWGLSRSASVSGIFTASKNAGIQSLATYVDLDEENFSELVQFCKQAAIDLVVIGPEAPLAEGITDVLEDAGINVFGPSKAAAQIEGSKIFMKECAKKYGIPSAEFASFDDPEKAKAYITRVGVPVVIKTDGLAAGKGVSIVNHEEEAHLEIDAFFGGKHGSAGQRIVIEEFIDGEEASFFAICDGTHVLPFGSAQDHKRVGEGDTGPNTGGMGTYSPAPVVTDSLRAQVYDDIILPLVNGLADDGIPYKGVLFAGVMVDKNGVPKMLEYNVRFGDPEAQVVIPRFNGDLAEVLMRAAKGELKGYEADFSRDTALCVVMATDGYPGSYRRGSIINNLEQAESLENTLVFHAGTKIKDGKVVANGGRVLGVTAIESSVALAQQKAYMAVDTIDWPEGFCRRDIGWRAIARLKEAS